MHYRIRPSLTNISIQELVVVGSKNEEQAADPKIRRLWEDQQTQTSDPEPLYFMRRPKSAFLTDFVVEFVEFGCQYVFIASNGLGQWYYDPITVSEEELGLSLPAAVKTISHPFYSEDLVRVTAGLHKSLMILLLAGGKFGDWTFCHQPKSHYHQVLKVFWNLELYTEDLGKVWGTQDHPEIGYTTHVVCGSARLVDIFDALCGEKVKDKDELFLTDVPTYYDLVRYNYMRAAGTDRPMLKMVIGKSYSYYQGRIEQLWLCDLGWKVHVVDSAAWVVPSRRTWLEQSTKPYNPTNKDIGVNNGVKKDEGSLAEAIQGALDGDGALAGSQLLLAGN